MHESAMTERKLIEQFLEALRELPDISADLDHLEPLSAANGHGHDAQVDMRVAGTTFTLLIEVKKAVYPRDVRQVLWQFKEYSRKRSMSLGDEPISLLVADSISPGAKELLREERVGYYDSGGSLYLPAPGAYLYIDKPPPKTLEKSVRSLFSGRRAQVLHTLLIHHRDWFGVTELAGQAHVSPATSSQVLTELERFDWLVSRGRGPSKERHLREPAALLDAWVTQLAAARPANLRRYYVPGMKEDTMLKRMSEAFDSCGAEYEITHQAAAQCYAPFLSRVSQVRVRLLAGPSTDAAINELGARIVNEGANLALVDAKSSGELLFREQVGGVWLASPIQVYLDLLRGEGRAKELAEHLRQERIGF